MLMKHGTSGNDFLPGSADRDMLLALAGNDVVVGLDENDRAYGNQQNDSLTGNSGEDTLYGGQQNDVLRGGKDNDILFGDRDDDVVCGEIGNDTGLGGPGRDVIFANEGSDWFDGNQNDDTIYGGQQNDTLRGGKNNDVIWGDRDLDILAGEFGQDTCLGNSSNDEIYGNTENDQLYGNENDDTIYGGQQDDLLHGGQDNDVLFGDRDNDVVCGDLGNDSAVGNTGIDFVFGNKGDDWLDGNQEDDTVYGGQGNDTVRGGQNNDLLSGDKGNDLLYGDLGSDTVNGAEGDDTFVIGRRNDVPGYRSTGGPNIADADWLLEFGTGGDVIELIGGLTFNELNIFAGTEQYAGYTIIQDKVLGEYLAILRGVAPSSLVSVGDRFIASVLSPGAPTDGGVTNPPTDGGVTNPPTDGGVTNPPTDGGVTNPPTDGGVTNPPTDGGVTNPPTDGGVTNPPTDGGVTNPPTDGGVTNPPTDGGVTNPPTDGGVTNPPTDGGVTNPPTDGGGNPTPTQNNPPIAVEDSFTTDEDVPVTTASVLANDSDADGDAIALVSNTNPSNGTVEYNGNGTFTYTPVPGFNGNDSFDYAIDDGKGGTDSGTVVVTVNSVNDAPNANAIPNQIATEDVPFSFQVPANTFSDAEGEPLTYTATLNNGEPLPAWLTFEPQTGTFSGTPSNAEVGAVDVAVTATDPSGASVSSSFNLAIANANDAPIATPIPNQTATEDVPFSFQVPANSFSDPDAGEPLTYTATLDNGNPLPAWLTFEPQTGTFSGTPGNGDVGTLPIKVTATDPSGASVSNTFNLETTNTNDVPTAANAIPSQTATENTPFSFPLPANTFSDPDVGDTLTYAATLDNGQPLPSWLTFDPQTGSFSGTPSGGDVGTLPIVVTATDPSGASVSAPLNLTVNPAPVAVDDAILSQVLLSSTLTIGAGELLANDTDPQGQQLKITELSNAVGGIALLSQDGSSITFRADPSFTGTASFDYKVDNGIGGSDRATVKVPIVSQVQLTAIASGNGIPVGTSGFAINGEKAGDNSGFSVSFAGDVDGDGLWDVFIGARNSDPNGPNSGKSYVVFGKPDNAAVNLTDVAAGTARGFAMNGEAPVDLSAHEVSGAGDVNGDGKADVIVGAFGSDASGNGSGRSYIVFGKADTATINLSALATGAGGGFAINAEAPGDTSGISVSNAGDVNGDGLADAIVGAKDADANVPNSGKAYIVFGKADTAAVDLITVATGAGGGFTINGEVSGDWAGASVRNAGDVNGDQLADVVVGAPNAPGGTKTGKAYVVFGKASTQAVNLSEVAAQSGGGFMMVGEEVGNRTGASVSGAGDVNGDGLSDLVIGARGADPAGIQAGKSYVVFGKADGTTVNLSEVAAGVGGFATFGESPDDKIGRPVRAAGDVNGDGLGDLIFGAANADPRGENSGKSFVVFGKADGNLVNLSDVEKGIGGFIILGEFADDFAGNSARAAGDVNGDGFADMVIGANGSNPNGEDSGKSYIIFGGDFTRAVTHQGGSGDDAIAATAANDNIVGGTGNDILIGAGGQDAIYAGAGDDIIAIADPTFRRIDGGSGTDTLRLDGSGVAVDLTTTSDILISGIEKIDLTGNGNNSLSFNQFDLLALSDTSNQLIVDGNAGDVVTSSGQGWTFTGTTPVNDNLYNQYTLGLATLLVDADVTQTIA